MGRNYDWPPRTVRNVAIVQRDRDYYNIETLISNRLKAATNFVDRLDLEAKLEAHTGCVNCIEWSSNGKLLASGSDDNRVIIWNALEHRMVLDLLTPHQGNIFSVKFMPNSNDSLVASGAADSHIYIFDINREMDPASPYWKCVCHAQRVKRLATAPEHPWMLWSAGEDGRILQFDIREPHICKSDDAVQLIDLHNHIGPSAEAKCVAVNHRRPEQLAVGASDVYARIYDRRMIRLNRIDSVTTNLSDRRVDDNLTKNCVTYYCPGHLNKKTDRNACYTTKTITYLTFSPDGQELLVNMGSEQIYLYDLNNAEQPTYLELPRQAAESSEPEVSAGDTASTSAPPKATNGSAYTKSSKLPKHVEEMKSSGNEFMENEKYLQAINQYTDCIGLIPNHPVFYLNRATAYMRRNWYGDLYAGLKDCETALQLDPTYAKAHFRMTRALVELGFIAEANQCLVELKKRFPADTNNKQTKMLTEDIQSHLEREQDNANQPDREVSPNPDLSTYELHWRAMAKDYAQRFVGHCNTTTDIKEANYFGSDGSFVIAGSDEGFFYIWERPSNKIFSVYKGDSMIVNCVQPHPFSCLLATSGIDHEIRLWSPKPESGRSEHRIAQFDAKVIVNQQRMQADPFEFNASGAVCRTS